MSYTTFIYINIYANKKRGSVEKFRTFPFPVYDIQFQIVHSLVVKHDGPLLLQMTVPTQVITLVLKICRFHSTNPIVCKV